jgi:hypothetical protein
MLKKLLIIIILITSASALVLAVQDSVQISVGVAKGYHSYTKALNQRQDYYVECNGTNLINVTPIGQPILLETNNSRWCS